MHWLIKHLVNQTLKLVSYTLPMALHLQVYMAIKPLIRLLPLGQAVTPHYFQWCEFFADDAFTSLGMQLEWPGYIHPDMHKGLFMFNNKQDFLKAMRPWWNTGFQIHVHSNGSGGNQITLDALEILQAGHPRFNHRFTLEHFGISSTAQGRQVKALGALVSTNPYFVSDRADINANQIGTDRASLVARITSLIDQDVVVALYSDTPVGVPSPLLEVWIAVNRVGNPSREKFMPLMNELEMSIKR